MSLDYIDRVALAVKHTLRDESTEWGAWLMDWSEGRINRVSSLSSEEQTPIPEISIGAVMEEPEIGVSGQTEVSLPIGLRFTWQEPRRVLEDDDAGIGQAAHMAFRALNNNYYLVRPETGGLPLVRRRNAFRTLDFESIETKSSRVILTLLVMVEYRCDLDTQTWEISA